MAILTKEYQRIATGPVQRFGYATGYLELWGKYNSQSIVDNNTSVTWKLSLIVTGGYIGDYNAGKPVTINGTTGSQTTYIGPGEYYSQDLATFTETIPHKSDGTKDASANGSVTFTAWGQTLSVSGSATLPTIPRTSGVACSSPYIGDTATITIDRKSTLFTDTITYKIGSLNGTIAEKTTNTVLSLDTSSIADEIYALIPNDKEIEGTITCVTYNGDTQIGTSSASFNLYAKESVCKPTVSGTIVDTSEKAIELTGSANMFVRGVSKPKVTVNATANKSATIKSYSIDLNDGQKQNVQEYTFPKIFQKRIIVNAIDSRGYGNPYEIDLSLRMIEYVNINTNKISLERPEEASNEIILNLEGIWFNGQFSDTKTNALTASYQYKTSEETTWTDGGALTPTIEGNNFYISNLSLGNTFDYQKEYQFKVIFSDLVMTAGNQPNDIQVVPRGQEVVAIGEDGGWLYGKWFLNDAELGANDTEGLKIYDMAEILPNYWDIEDMTIDGEYIYEFTENDVDYITKLAEMSNTPICGLRYYKDVDGLDRWFKGIKTDAITSENMLYFDYNGTTVSLEEGMAYMETDPFNLYGCMGGDINTFQATDFKFINGAYKPFKLCIQIIPLIPIEYGFDISSMTKVKIIVTSIMPEIYSTEEVKTNKVWIDGKPIYRKVVNFTTGSSAGELSVSHGISNFEHIVNVSGFTHRTSDNECRPIPNFYRDSNNSLYALVIYYITGTEVVLSYGSQRTNMDGYIILEYTKTAD